MAGTAAPRSKLAIAFYILGGLLILSGLPDALAIYREHRETLGFVAMLPAVGVILFGGAVQILSDIRWHLASPGGDDNA